MTTHLHTRRAALVTGARVLAGAALVGVPTAAAIAQTVRSPDPELAAILDRWMPYSEEQEVCDCATCTALAATPFVCTDCGYVGTPLVHPCTCNPQDDIDGYESMLGPETTAESAERIRWLIENVRVHPCPCPAASKETWCAHGSVECPVCVDGPDEHWSGRENNAHPWEIIRDVRAALAARGLV
jgi:hypothetical protein